MNPQISCSTYIVYYWAPKIHPVKRVWSTLTKVKQEGVEDNGATSNLAWAYIAWKQKNIFLEPSSNPVSNVT